MLSSDDHRIRNLNFGNCPRRCRARREFSSVACCRTFTIMLGGGPVSCHHGLLARIIASGLSRLSGSSATQSSPAWFSSRRPCPRGVLHASALPPSILVSVQRSQTAAFRAHVLIMGCREMHRILHPQCSPNDRSGVLLVRSKLDQGWPTAVGGSKTSVFAEIDRTDAVPFLRAHIKTRTGKCEGGSVVNTARRVGNRARQ